MTSMMEEWTYNIWNFNNLSFSLNEQNLNLKRKKKVGAVRGVHQIPWEVGNNKVELFLDK